MRVVLFVLRCAVNANITGPCSPCGAIFKYLLMKTGLEKGAKECLMSMERPSKQLHTRLCAWDKPESRSVAWHLQKPSPG